MAQTKDDKTAKLIARTLKRVLAERDLTFPEAEEMLGVKRSTFESWVYARRAPREAARLHIARTFDLSHAEVGLPDDYTSSDGMRSEITALRSEIAGLREQLQKTLDR